MKEILFATTNSGKLAHAKALFEKSDITLLSLNDFPSVASIEETGSTFEENAVLKAKGYFAQIGIPTIGDDGGIMVDYLGGAPGVHSRRFLGREASDEDLAEAVVEKLKGIPYEKRNARLGGVMIFWDGVHLLKSEAWIEGIIIEKVVRPVDHGLPYRSILCVPEYNKVLSQLTDEERDKINFRSRNLKNLLLQIEKIL